MTLPADLPSPSNSSEEKQPARRGWGFKIAAIAMSISMTLFVLFLIPVSRNILLQEFRVLRRNSRVWYQDSIADLFARDDLEAVHRQFLAEAWPPGSVTFCPDSGYTTRPGFNGHMYCENARLFRNYPLLIHHAGYRISENADQRLFRKGGILTTGCSYTFGDEIAGKNTFSSVMGTELFEEAGAECVYNFGVCQSGYPEMLHRLERLERTGILRSLAPQYLVIGCINDLARRSFLTQFSAQGLGASGKSYISLDNGEYTLHHFRRELDPRQVFAFRDEFFGTATTFPRSIESRIDRFPLAERTELLRKMAPIVQSTSEAYWEHSEESDRWYFETLDRELENDAESHPGVAFYEFVFREFCSIAKRNQIRGIFVMWLPQHGDAPGKQHGLAQQAIKTISASDMEITFVDGWDVIRNHKNWQGIAEGQADTLGRTHPGEWGHLATVWNCGHPDEISHRLYGIQLANVLRDHNLHDPSPVTYQAPEVNSEDPLFLETPFVPQAVKKEVQYGRQR